LCTSSLSILTTSLSLMFMSFQFFFFQAEDGIRDFHVTGVQTCALPICLAPCARDSPQKRPAGRWFPREFDDKPLFPPVRQRWGRSEERRVGKECRSGGAPSHGKKKSRAVEMREPARRSI